VATPPAPPPTPEFMAWLAHEQAWGRHALRAIAARRRSLLVDSHGLEQFAIRMAIVDLTGAVARWAGGLHDGLSRARQARAAAAFAASPPFAAADPTTGDCDRLAAYVEERMELLEDLLSGASA